MGGGMSESGERNPASGLLHDLDDIRSLLEERQGEIDDGAEEYIPLLDDAVDPPENAIPVLEDALPPSDEETPLPDDGFAAFTRPPDWENLPDILPPPTPRLAGAVFGDGDTITERLVSQGLDAALRARIDATLEHWINETLQVELALLRARLQDAVKTEIEAFISQEINRSIVTGKTHGE
jgi:hypothetical protein